MADATLTRLDVQDGVLHLYGTNFTQTTTTVLVDDATVTHAYVSATELTVDPAPAEGSEVVVEKGGIQSEALTIAAAEPGTGGTGGTGPAVDPVAPAPPAAGPLPVKSDDLKTEQDKGGPDPIGEPIEPGPAVETMQQQGIGARTPYPTGNPPAPTEPEPA